jgi:Fic family protein
VLQGVHDRGEWEEWVRFYLRGVSDVAKRSAGAAYSILELRETHRSLVATELGRGAASGLALLERLYSEPILNVNRAREATALTYRAAADLVDHFVQLGLLEEITGHARNRQFRYTPYVDIFEKQ